MDGPRFDDLARSLAGPRSRRSVLALAGSLLGLAGAALHNTTSAAPSRGLGSVCRNSKDCDSLLCGPADRTGRRRCVCPAGQQACGHRCVDPALAFQSDPANCGSCGRACATGAVCCEGICVPVVAVCRGVCCSANQVCTDSGCCTLDPDSVTCGSGCGEKTNNCGQPVDCGPCCGATDADCVQNADCCSETCVAGVCQAGPVVNDAPCDEATDCLSGTCCNNVCVDPASFATDPANCGSCGIACPGTTSECAAPTCIDGSCTTSYSDHGVPLTAQTDGDCRLAVCDGAGGVTTIADDTDAPARTDATCQLPICSNGAVSTGQAPTGTPCSVDGGSLCNGSGQCVECLIDEDCGGGICRSDETCCTPDSKTVTCAGLCGETTDNCGLTVDCGPCCMPDADEVTCAGKCGAVLNNCDEPVDCGECCIPDSDDITCAGQCGSVFNNCDQSVDCGTCCVPDADDVTCDGRCGEVMNNCEEPVDCGECCVPDEDSVTCAGLCGFVTNNCGIEVDCGECCVPDEAETTCAGQCGSILNNCDDPVDCGVCCDEGYEVGSDGETCVPTEATCNVPFDNGVFNMTDYDFRECTFANYEIPGRYFIRTNFTGANLAGAILNRSNFSGADFTGANLTGAIWNSATCPDDTVAEATNGTCCNNLNGKVPASC